MGEKQAVTALFPQKLDEPRRQHFEAERPCTDQSRLAKRFTATLWLRAAHQARVRLSPAGG
jgi:hypothetical protein